MKIPIETFSWKNFIYVFTFTDNMISMSIPRENIHCFSCHIDHPRGDRNVLRELSWSHQLCAIITREQNLATLFSQNFLLLAYKSLFIAYVADYCELCFNSSSILIISTRCLRESSISKRLILAVRRKENIKNSILTGNDDKGGNNLVNNMFPFCTEYRFIQGCCIWVRCSECHVLSSF